MSVVLANTILEQTCPEIFHLDSNIVNFVRTLLKYLEALPDFAVQGQEVVPSNQRSCRNYHKLDKSLPLPKQLQTNLECISKHQGQQMLSWLAY